MRKIIINGGKKLQGEVTVSGAKNSVVALIPAIILSDGVVTLAGTPSRVTTPSDKIIAGINATTEFLAPDTVTSP